jgi:hypothetical protein
VIRRVVSGEAVEPWLRADVQANRIASADWVENHPGFCYEFGDPKGDPFIPTEVLEITLLQERFFIALWQHTEITTIDVSHDPARTFTFSGRMSLGKDNWCDVTRYELESRNPKVVNFDEFLDPKNIVYQLGVVLRAPLGRSLENDEQSLLVLREPICRVLIEFPDAIERASLPLDTGISALTALAHKEYRSTIYGSDTV